MLPFTVHTGTAVPLRASDVDTDQILPAEYLKRVTRSGFEDALFAAWRKDPAFILEQPERAGASVLVANENFGTGSSREHAVWGLQDWGFRAVISPRFGDIFRGNAAKNGLLPVVLPSDVVVHIQDLVEANPTLTVTVDLEKLEVRVGDVVASFDVAPDTRWRLLNGLDDISLTLQSSEKISEFEDARPPWKPRVTGRPKA
jgi:3-isopropylmalate/(R)-2-methylmalate dehydratase small subunit